MNSSEPVAALEIGTSNTVIAIGEPLGDGRVRVAARNAISSVGVNKSRIMDIAQTQYSVVSLIKKLLDTHGYDINTVFLAVSGPHIKAQEVSASWQVQRGTVQEDDIAEVDSRVYDVNLPPERLPLELSHLAYTLDDVDGVLSPKGLSGHVLKLRALCIHADTQRINDARNLLAGMHLDVQENWFAGVCAAQAVLTPQLMRDGALVIDLGGGTTSFSAWYDGRLQQVGVIGVGGELVTNDIRIAFSISRAQAEQLKKEEASATIDAAAAPARVPLPASITTAKDASVSRRALNTVVNARMQELFTIIRSRMDECGCLHKLNAGVFLTGGGAALRNVVPLAASVFGCAVAVGRLVPEIEGLEDEKFPAAYATIAGALLRAQESAPPRGSAWDWLRGLFGGKK